LNFKQLIPTFGKVNGDGGGDERSSWWWVEEAEEQEDKKCQKLLQAGEGDTDGFCWSSVGQWRVGLLGMVGRVVREGRGQWFLCHEQQRSWGFRVRPPKCEPNVRPLGHWSSGGRIKTTASGTPCVVAPPLGLATVF
jgi:hypothetical protein